MIVGTKRINVVLMFDVPPGVTEQQFINSVQGGVNVSVGLGPFLKNVSIMPGEQEEGPQESGLKLHV